MAAILSRSQCVKNDMCYGVIQLPNTIQAVLSRQWEISWSRGLFTSIPTTDRSVQYMLQNHNIRHICKPSIALIQRFFCSKQLPVIDGYIDKGHEAPGNWFKTNHMNQYGEYHCDTETPQWLLSCIQNWNFIPLYVVQGFTLMLLAVITRVKTRVCMSNGSMLNE